MVTALSALVIAGSSSACAKPPAVEVERIVATPIATSKPTPKRPARKAPASGRVLTSPSVPEPRPIEGWPWLALADCESGDGDGKPPYRPNWTIENGPYSGGLQFLPSTWIRAGGLKYAKRPSQATPGEQIAIAKSWLSRTSWAQWPHCSRKIGAR